MWSGRHRLNYRWTKVDAADINCTHVLFSPLTCSKFPTPAGCMGYVRADAKLHKVEVKQLFGPEGVQTRRTGQL